MPINHNQVLNERILAIDPGTREMGVAFLEDRNLLDYGVKSLRGVRGARELLLKLGEITERLISEKKPDVIVLEKNQFSQIQANIRLTLAVSKIKGTARAKRIRLVEYAPRTIRKAVCNDALATKDELARQIAASYPELSIFLEADRKWKVRYWQNIFDSLGVGLCYLRQKQFLNSKPDAFQ